jgi:hypothetical protein
MLREKYATMTSLNMDSVVGFVDSLLITLTNDLGDRLHSVNLRKYASPPLRY